jgi:transcriptional regulator with XRE-family HTH domain
MVIAKGVIMEGTGGRLREARLRKVWTQEDLAAASGVPVVTISRIENGHVQQAPRQSTLRKLAAALDVDPAWLLFGEIEWEGKDAA